jgi:chromosome segregation ATPase
MAQTSQAWDWGVDLRDEERYELERLREAVAELRTQLDEARDSLRRSTRRQEEARQALRELDAAKPWQRRRVRSALRERHLL